MNVGITVLIVAAIVANVIVNITMITRQKETRRLTEDALDATNRLVSEWRREAYYRKQRAKVESIDEAYKIFHSRILRYDEIPIFQEAVSFRVTYRDWKKIEKSDCWRQVVSLLEELKK